MKNRIRELRERAGLTGEELARRIGTTSAQVYKLERGERRLTLGWLEKIAHALDCKPAELFQDIVVAGPDDVTDISSELDPAIVAGMASRGLTAYRVVGSLVTTSGVKPGDTIVVDSSPKALENIGTGDVALVQLEQPPLRVLRVIHRAPEVTLLLAMERPISAMSLDDGIHRPKIIGVVLRNPGALAAHP